MQSCHSERSEAESKNPAMLRSGPLAEDAHMIVRPLAAVGMTL